MCKLTFGKYKGESLDEVFKRDIRYIQWLAYRGTNSRRTSAAFAAFAAKNILARQSIVDDATHAAILAELRRIQKAKSHQGLKSDSYAEINVCFNTAHIDLYMYKDHFGHGMSDDFCSGGWDRYSLVLHHKDLIVYDENAWKKPIPLLPPIDLDATIWYPCSAQNKLLARTPMTLRDAIDFLDEIADKEKQQ